MCYEVDKQTTYTYEQLCSLIDAYYENDKNDNDKVLYEFLGGEPLLEFDMILRLISYIRTRYVGRELCFNITTNGTLITEKVIDFLTANTDVYVSISFDGNNLSHTLRIMKDNSNGFSAVESRILMLKDAGVKYSLHLVVTPYNVAYLFDNIVRCSNIYCAASIEIGIVESTIELNTQFSKRFLREMDKVSSAVISGEIKTPIDILERDNSITKLYAYLNGVLVGEVYGKDVDVKDSSEIEFKHTTGNDFIGALKKIVYANHKINEMMILNGLNLFRYKEYGLL